MSSSNEPRNNPDKGSDNRERNQAAKDDSQTEKESNSVSFDIPGLTLENSPGGSAKKSTTGDRTSTNAGDDSRQNKTAAKQNQKLSPSDQNFAPELTITEGATSFDPSTMKDGLLGKIGRAPGGGLTAELKRELSPEGPLRTNEFKWNNSIYLAANAGMQFQSGPRQFFQTRKSEFTPKPDEKPIIKHQEAVDNFLIDTEHTGKRPLSDAEKADLERSRKALVESRSVDELISNALHLARLYKHLQYIEEAKKAVGLSLGIDPDHMMSKQMFGELERMHPIDMGAVAPHVVDAYLTKSNLRKRIRELTGGRVVVVGDLLIDELLEGKPERISREAPVLILEHVDTELILGGAANTAHNIAALGGKCHAIGVCGADEYAKKLGALLESCGITHNMVQDSSRPTTVKTRILSKSHSLLQQLLRLDRICHDPISTEIESKIIAKIDSDVSGYKAIILSDYKSGVVSDRVIDACRKLAKKDKLLVIVDAQGDFSRFAGVSLMTPNQPDTEKAVGYEINSREKLKQAGAEILRDTDAEALLITRGAEGMALFQRGKDLVEIPVFNRIEVFDVTGAGDTVVGTMALALVSGASYVEAMALGNLAAGIVVRRSGTAVTSQQEMLENLERLNLPE